MSKEKNISNDMYLPDPESCLKKLKRTFPHLTDTELKTLLTPDSIRSYKKGTLLHEEGNCIKGCYFIYCGIVKIYQTGQEGKEQIILFDQEGDIFGFRSVIRHESACTSAKTLSDCILCYIPDKILLDLLENNSGFAYDMGQIACKELGSANRYIRDIAQKSVKARLAEILLLISNEFGIETDGTLKLNITREELSNFVGTATETVIRLLSDYKTEGLVEVQGRKIKLLNIEKIKTIAGL
ncbi:MAG: Crp/Fnr family transcriptional regulator [Odoribacter sp.]|nr:Crp/Fnr family transcriptional regulator [Odoribacter sp.]